jgi:hypothetical protein
VSSTSKIRWAELVARFMMRAICPMISIGGMNIVVYSRNATKVPDETPPRARRRAAAPEHPDRDDHRAPRA